MRAQKRLRHRMDGLLALLLFALFAACVLAVLLTGARAYRRLTLRDQASYNTRTCVQYVATRVRQADHAAGVEVAPFGETQALVLGEKSGFITRVYWYDGWLMELYSAPDAALSPENGTKLLPADGMEFTLEDGLLTAKITSGGRDSLLSLSLRSGKGAA